MMASSKKVAMSYIYNIGVLTVNIKFNVERLRNGGKTSFPSVSCRAR
jgi:acyl-CoA thioesterase